jgi:hypothetical protein
MIPIYASIAFLFCGFTRLCGEIKSLKRKLHKLEFSGIAAHGAGFCYKPQLTIQEQIAEELHLFTGNERGN